MTPAYMLWSAMSVMSSLYLWGSNTGYNIRGSHTGDPEQWECMLEGSLVPRHTRLVRGVSPTTCC